MHGFYTVMVLVLAVLVIDYLVGNIADMPDMFY
jgi:hypothetical protein